jgi:hypothetical protein
MKVFHCDHCNQLVFFESVQCLTCGATLGYAPDQLKIVSLESDGADTWRTAVIAGQTRNYRLCANYSRENVCNWLVADTDLGEFCVSCRLTRIVPDVTVAGNRLAWSRLENAKRRLIHQLRQWNLPLDNQTDSPASGLAFEFLADEPDGSRVITGHASGTITISVAEADDAEREQRRIQLHEPYRTLLGHFRHEVGHYYWERLIRDSSRLNSFRSLFGDETADYASALARHYETGAPADWQQRFVSAYASSHPWEDWAETWAHYLHLADTLETARDCGLMLSPRRSHEPALAPSASVETIASPFSRLMDDWFALTYILNNLNRGMGLPDGYPFILSAPAISKLLLVHDLIAEYPASAEGIQSPAPVDSPGRVRIPT